MWEILLSLQWAHSYHMRHNLVDNWTRDQHHHNIRAYTAHLGGISNTYTALVTRGEHAIRVDYKPEGRGIGLAMTIIGILLMGGYVSMIKIIKKND